MEYKQKIKDCLKENGKANLAELKKLNKQHQPILYNIRRLLADKEIRPHIEVNPEIIKSIGITDNEIFFTLINRYERPQDIKKLIEEMCSNDTSLASQALTNFISLCKEKGVPDESVKRTAYLLMSKAAPGLENQIAFSLAVDARFPEGMPAIALVGWELYPPLRKPLLPMG